MCIKKTKTTCRDKFALIFFLDVFLMYFLQYMQYYEINSKIIKNIVVLSLCILAIGAAITKKRWLSIDRKMFSIILFLFYAFFVEIITNTFSIENFYYLSVSFFAIIGGYSFSDSYNKKKIKNIISKSTIIVYIILVVMFFQNFFRLGFLNAGVQTSIVYPLVFFVLIGCLYNDNVTIICSVPIIYAGFILMARSVILLAVSIVLLKLIIAKNYKFGLTKKITLFLVFCGVSIYLFQFALQSSGSNIFEKVAIRGGDFSSGRNDIYLQSLSYFFKSSFVKMIFGNGADTASKIFGISGHSDFIQFLLNFGIIGMIWFAKIQFECIRSVKHQGRTTIKYIEIFVLILYMTINQFFLAVGPDTFYGLIIGMFAGQNRTLGNRE